MPARDANLVVRSTAAGTLLAATVISVEIDGTPLRGLCLYMQIPAATQGCNPTLQVDVHASSTSAAATTDPIIASRTGMTSDGVAKEYVIPFSTKKRAVAFAFTIGGGSTPGFSLVTAHITLNVGQDYDRNVEFR